MKYGVALIILILVFILLVLYGKQFRIAMKYHLLPRRIAFPILGIQFIMGVLLIVLALL